MSAAIERAGPWSKVRAIMARDMRVTLSYPGNFALTWATILVEVVVNWYIAQLVTSPVTVNGVAMPYFQYISINSAFMRFQTAALNSFAEAIRDAQLTGTLEMVLATPTRLPTLVLSSGLWSFALTSLQTIVFLAISLPFGLDLRHVNGLTALVFLVLTVASVSPLGVLAAALSMVIKKTGPIEWISNSSALLFGGVYFPLSRLPVGLQVVGWCLPITHSLNGFRAASVGAPLAQTAADAIWLLVASVVLMPLSLWIFTRAVRKARVDGTLAMY